MPSTTDHRAQAVTNEQAHAAVQRSPVDLFDWEITTLFYTAVHEIRAFLSRKDAVHRGGRLHYGDFDKLLRRYGEGTVADNFDQLKDWSQQARYSCKGQTWCQNKLSVAEQALRRIQARLATLHVALDAQGVPPDGPP